MAAAPPGSQRSLSFDPQLVERVIDLELWRRAGDRWERRHRRDTEELYRMPPDGRREGFARVARASFEELGHVREVEMCLGLMPRLAATGRTLRLDLARDAGGEGADFLERPTVARGEEATARIRAERFVDGSLRAFLLLELEHLEEILDPDFGYDPSPALAGVSPNARRMVQGRLASLWNAHARAELAGRGLDAPGDAAARRMRFPELVAMACADTGAARGGAPGAPCSLCGFATSEWASLEEAVAASRAVRADFAGGSPEQGACTRCLEAYATPAGGAR